MLGFMYANGRGVPEDDAEAVKWYRKAAEQGHAEAQYQLGTMYNDLWNDLWSALRDDAEAVKWYRMAAEQGHAEAQFRLGFMYDLGWGVPKDNAEAVKWYRKAAEQGHAEAQHSLGGMYDLGVQGVPEDDAEAAKWYRKAAEQGDASARRRLWGLIYEADSRGDYETAHELVRPLAEQGDALAQYSLGEMYDLGEGVPEDDAEAAKWYRKAAEQGDAGRSPAGCHVCQWLGCSQRRCRSREVVSQGRRTG